MVGMHTRHQSSLASVLLRLPGMRREARGVAAAARQLLEEFKLGDDADVEAQHLAFGKLRFLEIARAIAMRPRILLLDEPAAGLDEVRTRQLTILIGGIRRRGVGVLVVDHDVPFVFGLCDQVTVMNFGSVVASGTPDEIYNDPTVREAYLGEKEQEHKLK